MDNIYYNLKQFHFFILFNFFLPLLIKKKFYKMIILWVFLLKFVYIVRSKEKNKPF